MTPILERNRASRPSQIVSHFHQHYRRPILTLVRYIVLPIALGYSTATSLSLLWISRRSAKSLSPRHSGHRRDLIAELLDLDSVRTLVVGKGQVLATAHLRRRNSSRLVHLGGAFLRKRIAVLVETVIGVITYVAPVASVQGSTSCHHSNPFLPIPYDSDPNAAAAAVADPTDGNKWYEGKERKGKERK